MRNFPSILAPLRTSQKPQGLSPLITILQAAAEKDQVRA